jgi:hypothetical protein
VIEEEEEGRGRIMAIWACSRPYDPVGAAERESQYKYKLMDGGAVPDCALV